MNTQMQKNKTASLQQADGFFKALMHTINDGIVITDTTQQIIMANDVFCAFFGLDAKEVYKTSMTVWIESFGTDALARWHELEESVRLDGQCRNIEFNMLSGKILRFFNVNASLIKHPVDDKTAVISIWRDSTEHKQAEEALRESEQEYVSLIKNIPSIVYKGYKDWSVNFFDKKIESITGYDARDFNSRKLKWVDVIIEEDIERTKKSFIEALKTEKSYVREYRIKSKDGEICWIQERGQIVCDKNGEIECVNGVFFDITKRKYAEEALRESEAFNASLMNHAPSAILVLNSDTSIKYVNPAFEKISGFSYKELMGSKAPYPWQTKETLDKTKNDLDVATHNDVRKVEQLFQKKNGNLFWVEITSAPVESGGELKYYLSNWIDITERKQAEEQIRTLTQQLIKAQENERQMISRELHDRIGQDLSMLKILCNNLFDNQSEVPAEMRQRVSQLYKILGDSINSVRDMAYDLRPSSLDQLGLVRTLYQFCEDFSEKTGLNVDFNSAGMDELKLDFDTEINMYRLVQESLNNIIKHADAKQVTIKLVASFPKIILRIEDDGKGFDKKNRLDAAAYEKRMGIISMKERVSLLNGKIRINSSPAKGTKIFIEVPYKR
ncbi:MAG: PAS domain S-box protein [Desulfobacterales bacterium]|nr:MAG: PAS domain S-box protein [Desulfobacterales bacterium]